MTDVGGELPKPKAKINRRTVLYGAGLAAGAIATTKMVADVTTDIWQPKVIDLGLSFLEDPKSIEGILTQSAEAMETIVRTDPRAPGAPAIADNYKYTPLTKLIGEVLARHEKAGEKLHFQRVSDYEDLEYYLEKMHVAAHDVHNRDPKYAPPSLGAQPEDYVLGYIPNTLARVISASSFFPENVQAIFHANDAAVLSAYDLVQSNSGFYDRIFDEIGEDITMLVNVQMIASDYDAYKKGLDYWNGHKEKIEPIIREYLIGIKDHVEEIAGKDGMPVSAAEVFDYCLTGNGGSIDKSLMDTMLFLKFMARNDSTLVEFKGVDLSGTYAKLNEDWYKQTILDQYGKVGNYVLLPHDTFPYVGRLSQTNILNNDVDKDLHLLNQIGKPYHAFSIANLQMAVPPEVAQLGVAWRQAETLGDQGLLKTAADFRTALEGVALSKLFSQYTT